MFPTDDSAEAAHEALASLERVLALRAHEIAAVIVEPIQAEGGDRHASPEFFRGVRSLSEKYGVLMIVDEVQTGGGVTGTLWAHEQWDLETPPDMVTFSKRLQLAGFFAREDLRAPQPYRNFNTWLGSPIALLQANTIVDTINKDKLLQNVQHVAPKLMRGVKEAAEASNGQITNVRNRGFFGAFDLPSPEQRDYVLQQLATRRVACGACGDRSVRYTIDTHPN
ncbi:MAG: hypothetical protein MHM6MM_009452 [Cercozoa sp. M6MM]